MKRPNLIKGMTLLIFSIVVCYEAMRLPLWSGSKPGPGLFPMILGISLGLLSLIFIIVKGYKQDKKAVSVWGTLGNRKRILLTFGALISYAIVLPFLGFLISTFFLIFFLLSLSYREKWIVVGSSSLLISLGFYIVFQVLLKIQLPYGVLGIR